MQLYMMATTRGVVHAGRNIMWWVIVTYGSLREIRAAVIGCTHSTDNGIARVMCNGNRDIEPMRELECGATNVITP